MGPQPAVVNEEQRTDWTVIDRIVISILLGTLQIYTAYAQICLVPVSVDVAHLPEHEINQVSFIIPTAKPELSDHDCQLPFYPFLPACTSKQYNIPL